MTVSSSIEYAVVNNSDRHVAVVCANVRGRDEFWLPGGGMYDGESPQQTIAREVREELGRHATPHHRIGQAIQFFYAGDENCWYKMLAPRRYRGSWLVFDCSSIQERCPQRRGVGPDLI